MIFFAIGITYVFVKTSCAHTIVKNLQLAFWCFLVYCYPVLLSLVIEITDDVLFYMYTCNAFLISSILFISTRWWFKSEINQSFETIINLHGSTISDIAIESSFNFPHTVQWSEIKGDLEEALRLLDICLEEGDVSYIFIFGVLSSFFFYYFY